MSAEPLTRRRPLRTAVAVTDPLEVIMALIRTELAQGIVQPEAVRAFIHPPTIFRSPDDVAEADEIQRLRREKAQAGD